MNALDFLNSCNHCAALVAFVVYCRRSFRHLACIIRLGENGLCAPPHNHSPPSRHRRYLPPTWVSFPPIDITHITNVRSNLRSPSVAKWSVSALPECSATRQCRKIAYILSLIRSSFQRLGSLKVCKLPIARNTLLCGALRQSVTHFIHSASPWLRLCVTTAR